MSAIYDLIKKIADSGFKSCMSGTFKNVNKDTCLCDFVPNDGGADVIGVRIGANEVSGTRMGIRVFPKEGTMGQIVLVDNLDTNAHVLFVQEFDEVLITLSNVFKLELKPNGDLIINDGNLGPLVKIQELISLLNTLQNNVNLINQACQSAFASLSGLDSGASQTAYNTIASGVQNINTSNLGNNKIKQ